VYRVSGTTAIEAILAGVLSTIVLLLLVAIGLSLTFHLGLVVYRGPRGDFTIPLWMGAMAAAGGIISVLTGLNEVARTHDYDPLLIFCTGFFKPWIALIFSFVLLCFFESGLSPFQQLMGSSAGQGAQNGGLDPARMRELAFLLVIAFIGGFSERLLSDFALKSEGQFFGASKSSLSGGRRRKRK
jgi:hypothetical protein